MTHPIRILLADDHAVLRAGLRALLNAEPDMQVVGEAGDGLECVRCAAEIQPDLVLLDINMPHCNGLQALDKLRLHAPQSRVLVLTMHDDPGYLRQVLASGGAGYVLKQAADNELLAAIRTVASGGIFLHPQHTKTLLDGRAHQAPPSARPDPAEGHLSPREREVLRLIVLGHRNQEIAETLCLSVRTVETYKARLMEKLGVRNRAGLVQYALDAGILEKP